MRAMSPKRRRQLAERARVRDIVLERDGGCRAQGAPGRCGTLPGRPLMEVHEIESRGRNPHAWLDPDLCVAICPRHHDWVTEHPADAEKLGLYQRTSG